MNFKKLYYLIASITDDGAKVFEYFDTNKYAVYSFNELGKITHLDGEENQITKK